MIEYETFRGKPTNLRPMPLTELVLLTKGEKAYVWWAKDGNLNDIRVSEVCTIDYVERTAHGFYVGVAGGDVDIRDETLTGTGHLNSIDWSGRGEVFFYYPPKEKA